MKHAAISCASVGLAIVLGCGATLTHAQSARQVLDVNGSHDLRLVSNGDVVILIAQSAQSEVAVLRSVGGGPFVPTDFGVPRSVLERRIFGAWATARGFFTVQHAPGLLPRLSHSIDGARWQTIDSPAFEVSADIHHMAQLASGDVLAVGAERSSVRPSTGPFRAAMWRSIDGIIWRRVELPDAFEGSTSLGSIAAQGSAVVVSGQRPDGATWLSEDDGASWTVVNSDAREGGAVAHVSGRFVQFVTPTFIEEPHVAFATSTYGREWQTGEAAALIDDGLRFSHRQTVRTAAGVFVVGSTALDLRKRLDWCYVAPTDCTRGSGSLVVLHTATGDDWHATDVASLLGPGVSSFAVAETNTGTVIAGGGGQRTEILTAPPASWPLLTARSQPEVGPLPTLPPDDGSIEPGTIYRYPIGTQCMAWLGQFNGRVWKIQPPLTAADRRRLEALPQVHQTVLGTIRLTGPDTIEYAVEGIGVVAVYEPTSEPASLCL